MIIIIITTNNQTPTQSSANYMNYETSENHVSQPIPENCSQRLILLLVMLLLCYVHLHV